MTLHLVFSIQGWHACRRRQSVQDSVVLIGDGVYAYHAQEHADVPANVHIVAEDAHIRGLKTLPQHLQIGYDDLVALCADHQPVISWND